jgi:hypothetical protein
MSASFKGSTHGKDTQPPVPSSSDCKDLQDELSQPFRVFTSDRSGTSKPLERTASKRTRTNTFAPLVFPHTLLDYDKEYRLAWEGGASGIRIIPNFTPATCNAFLTKLDMRHAQVISALEGQINTLTNMVTNFMSEVGGFYSITDHVIPTAPISKNQKMSSMEI